MTRVIFSERYNRKNSDAYLLVTGEELDDGKIAIRLGIRNASSIKERNEMIAEGQQIVADLQKKMPGAVSPMALMDPKYRCDND